MSPAFERERSRIMLIVAVQRGASPENMFPRLVPPPASRPSPVRPPALDLGRIGRVVGYDRAA